MKKFSRNCSWKNNRGYVKSPSIDRRKSGAGAEPFCGNFRFPFSRLVGGEQFYIVCRRQARRGSRLWRRRGRSPLLSRQRRKTARTFGCPGRLASQSARYGSTPYRSAPLVPNGSFPLRKKSALPMSCLHAHTAYRDPRFPAHGAGEQRQVPISALHFLQSTGRKLLDP